MYCQKKVNKHLRKYSGKDRTQLAKQINQRKGKKQGPKYFQDCEIETVEDLADHDYPRWYGRTLEDWELQWLFPEQTLIPTGVWDFSFKT